MTPSPIPNRFPHIFHCFLLIFSRSRTLFHEVYGFYDAIL